MKIGFSGQYTYWTPANKLIEETTTSLFDNGILDKLQKGINEEDGYTIKKSLGHRTYILNNKKNEPTTVTIGYSNGCEDIRFSREGLTGQENLILNKENTNKHTWNDKAKKIIKAI